MRTGHTSALATSTIFVSKYLMTHNLQKRCKQPLDLMALDLIQKGSAPEDLDDSESTKAEQWTHPALGGHMEMGKQHIEQSSSLSRD